MNDRTMKNDRTMNKATNAAPQLSRPGEQLTAPAESGETEANAAPVRNRIPLTVRSRSKVLRIAPPIDDGFRPFRVF
jgi:hypothetical protein